MEFDVPPADTVLAILAEKAKTDGRLAAQIEAAQWQAIAVIAASPVNENLRQEDE